MEQAKGRRRAYRTHIKSVAEFSESWVAEISRGGCDVSIAVAPRVVRRGAGECDELVRRGVVRALTGQTFCQAVQLWRIMYRIDFCTRIITIGVVAL